LNLGKVGKETTPVKLLFPFASGWQEMAGQQELWYTTMKSCLLWCSGIVRDAYYPCFKDDRGILPFIIN